MCWIRVSESKGCLACGLSSYFVLHDRWAGALRTAALERLLEERRLFSTTRHVSVRSGPWPWTLVYVIFVILFGAVVRITGSGAGCGQHWPSCHGEVVHLPQSVETLIELTHRVTSGLSVFLVLGALVYTGRVRGRRHLSTRAAGFALGFLLLEALLGAALVLLELVGSDASHMRALVMALHLVNTALLMLALVIAAWAFGRRSPALGRGAAGQLAVVLLGGGLLLLVSASGAVTALGDTVLPVAGKDWQAGLSADSGAHFLERVRGVHPVLATLGALVLFWSSERLAPSRARGLLPWAVGLQLLAGLANVWLSAPGWMQVVHLALANLVWLIFVWASLETLGRDRSAE
jgi:cytochrome c oxidase assembly protein subunit 15